MPTRVPAQLKALVLEVMDEVLDKPKEGVLGSDVQVNAFIGVPSEPFVYGTISGGFQVKSLQALNRLDINTSFFNNRMVALN